MKSSHLLCMLLALSASDGMMVTRHRSRDNAKTKFVYAHAHKKVPMRKGYKREITARRINNRYPAKAYAIVKHRKAHRPSKSKLPYYVNASPFLHGSVNNVSSVPGYYDNRRKLRGRSTPARYLKTTDEDKQNLTLGSKDNTNGAGLNENANLSDSKEHVHETLNGHQNSANFITINENTINEPHKTHDHANRKKAALLQNGQLENSRKIR